MSLIGSVAVAVLFAAWILEFRQISRLQKSVARLKKYNERLRNRIIELEEKYE